MDSPSIGLSVGGLVSSISHMVGRKSLVTTGMSVHLFYFITLGHHAPATARAPKVCTLVPFIFLVIMGHR